MILADAVETIALITGVPDAVEQSLAVLTPYLVPSVSYWPLDRSWPPPGDVRTLVIRDVQELALAEQQALSRCPVRGRPRR